MKLIESTKISRIISRDAKKMLAGTIVKVSRLIKKENIKEIDINPVFILGNDVVVGDVRIIV